MGDDSNIDAISRNGDRYSIKATTGKVTGVFYGLYSPNSTELNQQKFEYVILVILDKNLSLEYIIELTWNEFLKYKRWHSRMQAWNLPINKDILENTKCIYRHEQN